MGKKKQRDFSKGKKRSKTTLAVGEKSMVWKGI